MGFPYLNNIMLPTKWPKGRVVRIVGRSCAQVSSNLEQREKELTYCSISRIEKWGDSGLQSIHTEQKDHEWSRATWHQGKVYAKVIKSVISVFYVAIFTFFFFFNNQLALVKARGNVKNSSVPEIRKEWEKSRMSSLFLLVLQNMDNDFTSDGNSIFRLFGNT